ncbi:MAG: hypothetical protein ACPGXK_06690 [Phycisphaerae bacterium]
MITGKTTRAGVLIWGAMLIWATMLLGSSSLSASIVVDVARVGYPTIRFGNVVRYGQWTPVIVDVTLLGEPSFDGRLRMAYTDTDGDRAFDQVEVHLRQETGGQQRYTLYTLADIGRNVDAYAVELLDEQNEVVQVFTPGSADSEEPVPERRVLPSQRPSVEDHDKLLVLSITEGTMGRVSDIAADARISGYEREVMIGHISPRDVPEVWHGLESVDFIVWDEAKPEDLNAKQVDAIKNWVQAGGTLLMAAARTAGQLALTDHIAELMPVVPGDVVVTDRIPLRQNYLQSTPEDDKLRDPVPVVACTLRDGAVSLAKSRKARPEVDDADALEPADRALHETILSQHRLGNGRVIFSGIALNDLFSGATGSAVNFFGRLFYLRKAPEGQYTPKSLYGKVIGSIAFARSAGNYLALATFFLACYVLVATWGTWLLLGKKFGRQHSWTAFAIVAGSASLISVMVVQWQQGFGDRLHQFAILDLDAGQRNAYATAYFGLKTSSDRRLDVWLPPDPLTASDPAPVPCGLRPIPPGPDIAQQGAQFIDPTAYLMVPASAEIHNMRVRATLKRLEGKWQGRVKGTFNGQITTRRNPRPDSHYTDWRITADSFVVNDLGIDLTNCFLIQPVFDIDDISGIHRMRSEEIYVYDLGDIPADGKQIMLAPRLYDAGNEDKIYEQMKLKLLARWQTEWGNKFRSFLENLGQGQVSETTASSSETETALMLLSTIGEYDPAEHPSMAGVLGTLTWSRDRLRQLDLRGQLQSDSVYLVGFARDPGPMRIFRRTNSDDDYRPLEPEAAFSRSMYRIRIPVRTYGERGDVPDNSETPL